MAQICAQATKLGMRPRYEHACPNCWYIGSTYGPSSSVQTVDPRREDVDQFEVTHYPQPVIEDWYLCTNQNYPTILARYSDDGPDYWSMSTQLFESLTEQNPLHVMSLARDHNGRETKVIEPRNVLAAHMLNVARVWGLVP